MSSQSSAQKASKANLEEASDLAKASAQQQLGSPEFAQMQALVGQILGQPLTFGPEQRDALFRSQAAIANQSASDFLTNAGERATVGSGFRSGGMDQARILAASGLGEGLAAAQRQVELAGAQQDRADLQGAIGTAQNFLGQQSLPTDKVTNALLGQGQVLGSFGPEQQGIGGAFGGILGSAAGGLAGNSKLLK